MFAQVLRLGRGQVSLTPSALAVGRLHLDWAVHLETEEETQHRQEVKTSISRRKTAAFMPG